MSDLLDGDLSHDFKHDLDLNLLHVFWVIEVNFDMCILISTEDTHGTYRKKEGSIYHMTYRSDNDNTLKNAH